MLLSAEWDLERAGRVGADGAGKLGRSESVADFLVVVMMHAGLSEVGGNVVFS